MRAAGEAYQARGAVATIQRLMALRDCYVCWFGYGRRVRYSPHIIA